MTSLAAAAALVLLVIYNVYDLHSLTTVKLEDNNNSTAEAKIATNYSILKLEDNNNSTAEAKIETNYSILRKENGYYIKGSPLMSKEWIISQLEPFLKVYDQRPDKINTYGTKLMHQLALWCIIRKLEPNHIIESGIYQGLGTWIIRKAAPQAQLILVDPHPQPLMYQDQHSDTIYLTNKKFQDFNDIDWSAYISDPSKTLLFVDDHQYPITRLQSALNAGMKHVMFDDNYWSLSGDVFSLRQFSGIFLHDLNESIFMNFKGTSPKDKMQALNEAKLMFDNHIEKYYEFPILWNCTPRGTNLDNQNILFRTNDGVKLLRDHGLTHLPPIEDIRQYINIAYVHLKL